MKNVLKIGLLLSLTISATGVLAGGKQPVKQPNILWIISEDLSPFMGCYNDPVNTGHTPSIDRLADSGVLFTRAFATAPVCSASRSALITGVMQTTTGTHNHRSSRANEGEVVPEPVRIYLPEGMKTLPELMREAGYFTFNSGKDDYNFHYDRRALYSVGTMEDYKAGMNGWQGNRAVDYISFTVANWSDRPDKSQPWFGQMQINGGKVWDNRYVREGEMLDDYDVELPPYFPDTPAHRKAWTTHYNANRGADVRVQQILDQLKADGELDNTIVFFFSDHGSNTSLRHKQFCYEGGMHVPLMIAGNHPWLKAGTVRTELVSLLDVSATTIALGGLNVPDYYDGQNLFGNAYEPAEYILGARDRCDFTIDTIRTVRSEKFRYIRNYHPERTMSQPQYRDKQPVVKDMHRLHEEGGLTAYQEEHWFGRRPEEELYELASDPHQTNNLAVLPAYADILKKHRSVLEDWQQQHGDKGLEPEPAVSLQGTYELWKDKPVFKHADVNPEYNQFR
ncbi:sulfatase family protein [Pontiella agarivorans]|uniref:Sulfatase n=1 Tax=Pontiella agarivorans TaxID=3038953 RepID=A0ABU5MTL6_9BACT|nr:sulfatase [Pontiella agarivorans]MDZ8117569.1 sulfatase [Pontiella agarivorans]